MEHAGDPPEGGEAVPFSGRARINGRFEKLVWMIVDHLIIVENVRRRKD